MIRISRRRFLALSGGLLVTAGCTSSSRSSRDSTGGSTVTSVSVGGTDAPERYTGPVLVLVQLNGGNDGLNTLVPTDGRYRDARPTLGIGEADLLTVGAISGATLHPSLAPLVPLLDNGRLAMVQSIGFPDPDRSHFISLDRWWRADDFDKASGWLGRWLDTLPGELGPLDALVIGGSPRALVGDMKNPTVLGDSGAFTLPDGLDPAHITAMASPPSDDELVAATQQAFARAVAAVHDYDAVVTGTDPTEDDAVAEGAGPGPVTAGLNVAAQLIAGAPGTRVVIVSAGGFDTHANQLADQSLLLGDVATGIAGFMDALDASGNADRVMLATTSEFGRRVAENGSGGSDHGAAGLSLVAGTKLNPGVHGEIDWTLLDGDLRPTIDSRALFTNCLDWLEGDVDRVLGKRYDGLDLLTR